MVHQGGIGGDTFRVIREAAILCSPPTITITAATTAAFSFSLLSLVRCDQI